MMKGSQRDMLRDDIEANGVLTPIMIHEGMILDGRNRYELAQQLCVPCPEVPFTGTDPLAFVISANLARRHLTTAQRAAIAADLANLSRGNPNLKKAPIPSKEGIGQKAEAEQAAMSAEQAAKMMNVGRASVERAKAVKRADPEAHERAKRGEKAAPKRHQEKVAKPPETAQQKFDRLIGGDLEFHRMFYDEVHKAVEAKLPEAVENYKRWSKEATDEVKKYKAMRDGIPAQMTVDDYKFLLNVLHPDRAPKDSQSQEKFAKAFDIVRKLHPYFAIAAKKR